MTEHYPPLSPRGEHEEFESSRDLPSKNRKTFDKSAQDESEIFVQVETKPGLAWTEPEQKDRERRVRQNPPTTVDAGPSVQVETNSAVEAEPVVQLSETSAEKFNKRVAEVAEMLNGRNLGDENPIEDAKVFMEGKLLTLEEVKHTLEEQLKNNPDVLNITNVKIEEEDDGLRMNVAITTAGGKATISGLVVNDVSGLSMRDLDVDANLLIRGRVKNAFSDFSSVIKSQLEKQYGKPISSIQIGKSGINVEFGPTQVEDESRNGIEPAIKSEIDVEAVTAIPNLDKPTVGESRRFNLLNYVKNRNGLLEKQSMEIGFGTRTANFVRNTGEWYRKLPLKYKIGVAGALLGMNVATGGASTLVTLFTSAAMIGQRALGSAAAFALVDGLYEKRLARKEKERGSGRTKFEKWKKHGYSTATALAVFTGLPGYAVKEGFDAIGGGGMLKALGTLMGVSPSVTELTPTTPAPTDVSAKEATRIMEQAKEQLAKEITARDEIQTRLDQVKQQIVEEKATVTAEASTPQESRETLRDLVGKITELTEEKSPSFEMPKHADFSIHEDDTTISPYDVTPTDQSGVVDDALSVEEVDEQAAPVTDSEVQPVEAAQPAEAVTETTRSMPIQPESPTEIPAPITEPEEVVIKQPTEAPTIDVTVEQATAEVPNDAPTPAQEVVTNSFGLNIPTTESHVYSGNGERLYVFGGTTADHSKAIREFFSEPENAKKILYTPPVTGGSHVIGWIKSPDGAIMSSGPLEADETNWFGMRKYVEKIELDMLRKKIN